MTSQIESFVTQFYNLEGITVAERRRNLFRLFNQASVLHENDSLLDALTARLQPRTYLQEVFLVEFWICFHRYEELGHELLVKENPLVIKKIKNEKWFFERLLSENRSAFVTKVVSTISYSLTLKILKYVLPILSEQDADAIFGSLLETYGISLASQIMTSCSCTKTEEVLKNHSVQLRSNQLKLLFDKRPSLVYVYLEEREKYEGKKFMDGNPIFEHIAQRDIDAYQDLCRQYGFKIKLGKRVSSKFIAAKRQDILARPELYVKNLHARCLIKKLGPDFPGVYLKLFPRSVDDSPSSEASRLLRHYPKHGRYDLLVATYNKIFAKPLDDSPHLIDEHVLEMISDPRERERLAKLKGREDPDAYVKYYSPENCLASVKEKINFARLPYERGCHVTTLVQSCMVNEDYDALLEAAKFVAERFKNDSPEVQDKFLQVLLWNKADFGRLRQEHWNEIRKMTARSDVHTHYDHTNNEIFCKYVEFLYKTGGPVKDEMIRFFKRKDFSAAHVEFIRDRHAQKEFLTVLIEIAPDTLTDSKSIEPLDCQIVAACFKYNSKNRDPIDVLQYPRLLTSVKSTLANKITVEEAALASALELLLCSKSTSAVIEELRELFWSTTIQGSALNVVRWFVKHRPEFIEKNSVAFFTFALDDADLRTSAIFFGQRNVETCSLRKDVRFWRFFKCYSHLGLDKKCVEFCSAQLTPEKCLILSHLMPAKDFLSLVESHNPDFNIQKALLNGLRNISAPSESLSSILQFCDADHVPSSLGPLYSAASKLPRTRLETRITDIQDRVAVARHAYYISSLALDKRTVLRRLEGCRLERSLMLVFKNFVRNPSEEAWTLFLRTLHAQESFDKATSIVLAKKNVPVKDKAEHFESVWTGFHRTNNTYKSVLFKSVQRTTITELRRDFMRGLVQAELFKTADCNRLISIYIIGSSDGEKIGLLGTALDAYRKSEQFSIKAVNEFVSVLFASYMEWNTSDDTLTHALLATFERNFPVAEIFEEYVTLSCMRFKNQEIKHLAQSVIELHNSLLARYGESITGIFANVLKKLVPHFCKTNLEKYQVLYFLLTCRKSVPDALLVIKVLPSDAEAEDAESDQYYELVLKQLQELDLADVQLHLNCYFKSYQVPRNVSYYHRGSNNMCINTSSWLCPGARRKIGYCYH